MAPLRTTNLKLWDETRGTHIFLVGNTLYKLDASALARVSDFLENLLDPKAAWHGGHSSNRDGSESRPVVIADKIAEPEFEIFASRPYGLNIPKDTLKKDVLVKLLQLSDYFVSPSTREYAIDQIQGKCFSFEPSELIGLSYQYHTRVFFRGAFERLVKTPFHSLSDEEVKIIGFENLFIIAKVKESVQEHHRIMATEPAQIRHHRDCANNARCEEDWYAIWWNGIGRLLLDGRNVLPWDEVVSRFEKLSFGEVGEGCRRETINQLKLGEGYRHGDTLMRKVGDELAMKIKELDGSL
ncbi:hypothetical protein BDZ97DRAFT_2077812 [Flammula alnicola]|nr:hypothetical protein BDZ97DRAFT_1931297 [Flammula alnicola]KAF8959785.1 hypothetical protein BDZ97DRAFT_2077812 [Flammula alnicola]